MLAIPGRGEDGPAFQSMLNQSGGSRVRGFVVSSALGPGSRSGFAPGAAVRAQSVVPSPPWTAQSPGRFSAASLQTSAPIPVLAMGCWWPGEKSPIHSSLQGINVSALQFPQFTAALDNF